jgi:hypothetical protein
MLAKSLLFAAALSATGLAIDLDDNEVPYQCRDVCSSIVKLTKDCDVANCTSFHPIYIQKKLRD